MDNTIKKYALVLPYVLDPRIKKIKLKQAIALYIMLFIFQNNQLRYAVLVFCVASNSTVLCPPKISHSAPFLPKEYNHG